MSDIFFTSDTHFGHANIIQHCERPFASVEEMTEKLIENWNACVKAGDRVYHLGDFALKLNVSEIESIVRRLHGEKFLVWGNHDQKNKSVLQARGFAQKWSYHELKIGDQNVEWIASRIVGTSRPLSWQSRTGYERPAVGRRGRLLELCADFVRRNRGGNGKGEIRAGRSSPRRFVGRRTLCQKSSTPC